MKELKFRITNKTILDNTTHKKEFCAIRPVSDGLFLKYSEKLDTTFPFVVKTNEVGVPLPKRIAESYNLFKTQEFRGEELGKNLFFVRIPGNHVPPKAMPGCRIKDKASLDELPRVKDFHNSEYLEGNGIYQFYFPERKSQTALVTLHMGSEPCWIELKPGDTSKSKFPTFKELREEFGYNGLTGFLGESLTYKTSFSGAGGIFKTPVIFSKKAGLLNKTLFRIDDLVDGRVIITPHETKHYKHKKRTDKKRSTQSIKPDSDEMNSKDELHESVDPKVAEFIDTFEAVTKEYKRLVQEKELYRQQIDSNKQLNQKLQKQLNRLKKANEDKKAAIVAILESIGMHVVE